MAINTGDTVLADLQEIVGRDFVREAAEGDAIDGVRPRFVVEPGSVEEVSALLRLSHRAGLAVAPRGGGTTLGWGATPRRLDLILSTARLNHVLEHAAGDLVVRAEAGVTLETLQAAVGAAGQRLALNPPEVGATLGGVVAANPSGSLRLRYGTVRDLLIGVTVVLADGTVAKAGGKVVKNVAGYDLCKLFTGSLGTLGVVVETIWRLHPLPAARRTVAIALASPEAAGAAVQALLHTPGSPLVLDALELRWEWPSPPVPRLTGPSAAADGPARLSLTVGEGETPKLSAGSAPVDPHARLYGGGAREGSPQAPPEARWTAGRSRGASQPWAGGARKETQTPLEGARESGFSYPSCSRASSPVSRRRPRRRRVCWARTAPHVSSTPASRTRRGARRGRTRGRATTWASSSRTCPLPCLPYWEVSWSWRIRGVSSRMSPGTPGRV